MLLRTADDAFRVECWRSFSDYVFTFLSEGSPRRGWLTPERLPPASVVRRQLEGETPMPSKSAPKSPQSKAKTAAVRSLEHERREADAEEELEEGLEDTFPGQRSGVDHQFGYPRRARQARQGQDRAWPENPQALIFRNFGR